MGLSPAALIILAKETGLGYNLARFVGRVAQLVRALLSHSRGPGFESLRAHTKDRFLAVFYFISCFGLYNSPIRISQKSKKASFPLV